MRLLPILIVMLVAAFGFKILELTQSSAGIITDSVAQSGAPEKKPDAGEEKKEDAPPAGEKKPEGGAPTEEKDAEKKEAGEKAADADQTDAESANEKAPPAAGEPAPNFALKGEYSQTEIEILQSLSKRRGELEEFEKALQLRETILKATEDRLEGKIAELKTLKQDVDALLNLYNEKEQEKIRSLVKIYETMKPKDAASIFEELDMNVLLDVVDKMPEKKLAPILAKMTPARAKEVTVELAKQRQLPDTTGELGL